MAESILDIPDTLRRARRLHQAGQLQEAEQRYQQVLKANPDHADANHLLGVLAYQVGKFEVAAQLISRAILSDNNQAPYFNNLGLALQAQGQFDKASLVYLQAIALDPGHADAHNNLGIVLETLGRLDEALVEYDRALDINPDLANAHNSRGLVLHKLGRLEEARAALQRAITIEAGFAEAHNNLGNSLQAQGRIDDALAAYHKVLEIDPGHARAGSNLLLCMNYSAAIDADTLFAAHRDWDNRVAAPLAPDKPRYDNDTDPQRRLRIGYVSADFCRHPVASFIEPVLASHDRRQVEVYCYANVPGPDEVTKRLQGLADHWRPIAGLADDQVADRVRQDGIDILVDLSGHTAGNRLLVFARRPAPVQVTYLGYPSTTGMSTMDYRITDDWLDPPGMSESVHAETPVRIAGGSLCFMPPGEDTPLPPRDTGTFIFASFNNTAKISPKAVALWSAILHAVPASRLLLKSKSLGDDATAQRLTAMFSGHGIDADRLEFIRWTPSPADHLALYNRVHVALDTMPYSGCTTTCEALWMGVPVITLAAPESRSRMSLAVLEQAGLGELVAKSEADYIARAAELANDPARLQALRNDMRERLSRSSLLDARARTQALEAAFREMWRRWLAGASTRPA